MTKRKTEGENLDLPSICCNAGQHKKHDSSLEAKHPRWSFHSTLIPNLVRCDATKVMQKYTKRWMHFILIAKERTWWFPFRVTHIISNTSTSCKWAAKTCPHLALIWLWLCSCRRRLPAFLPTFFLPPYNSPLQAVPYRVGGTIVACVKISLERSSTHKRIRK